MRSENAAPLTRSAAFLYMDAMALRPPSQPFSRFESFTGASALERELAGEKAAALGRLARAMEQALMAYGQAAAGERETRLRAAAEAVWEFFVQREVLGFTDQKPVIAHYRIPPEVLARLGER